VTNSAPTPAHPQGLATQSLVLLLFRETLGLSFDQCYYVVVLSFLLIAYEIPSSSYPYRPKPWLTPIRGQQVASTLVP